MDSASSITIVIVAYQSGAMLERHLPALRQLNDEFDAAIVVVDNASCDDTVEFLEESAPWIDVIGNDSNVGFARACNQAARLTHSEYILFLNPDAILSPADLRLLLREMAANDRAAIAAPALITPSGRIYPSAHADPNPANYWLTHSFLSPLWRQCRSWLPPQNLATRCADWVMGACLLVRRSAFEQVGGFPEAYFLYSEDAELCLNLRRAGWKILYVPQARCLHEHGGSSRQSSARTRIELFRSMRLYGERCRNDVWLRAMGRCIRLDMSVRLFVAQLVQSVWPKFDPAAERRKSFRAIAESWK